MNRLKTSISILSLAVAFSSCVKSIDNFTDFSTTQPIVELKTAIPYGGGASYTNIAGLGNFTRSALGNIKNYFVDTVSCFVHICSHNTLWNPVYFSLGIDYNALTSYNADANNVIKYELMPDSVYEWTDASVTIPAGQRVADVSGLVFHYDMIDQSKNYMLPIGILTADGVTISGNQGAIYFHTIGNPLAGVYAWQWTRFNAPDTTGAPNAASFTFADGFSAISSPVDPTTIDFQSGYGDQNGLNIRYSLTFTNTAGVLSNFAVKLKPVDVTDAVFGAIGALSYTEPVLLIADGVNKHFKFTWTIVNSAGAPRAFIDEYQF
jgi:hypothetical protein